MERSPWFTRDRPDRLLQQEEKRKRFSHQRWEKVLSLRGREMAKVRRIEDSTVEARLGKTCGAERALAWKKKPKKPQESVFILYQVFGCV
jgi:hypothetical protein